MAKAFRCADDPSGSVCLLCEREMNPVSQGKETVRNTLDASDFRYDHPEWSPTETPDPLEDDDASWNVEQETWTSHDELPPDSRGRFEEQMRNDARIWYRTIFPQLDLESPIDEDGLNIFLRQSRMLMRLFVALAEGLTSVDGNGVRHRWNHLPIVAALSHGGRVHFKTDLRTLRGSGADEHAMFRLITDAALDLAGALRIRFPKVPTERYLWHRGGSTHTTKWPGGLPVEDQPLTTDTRNQFATNLPIGGLGSPTTNEGEFVGFFGIPYTRCETGFLKKTSYRDSRGREKPRSYQHGHMLLRPCRHKEHRDWESLLIGVEGCENETTNMFGHKHTWKAIFGGSGEKRSVTGGDKLAKFFPVLFGVEIEEGLERWDAEHPWTGRTRDPATPRKRSMRKARNAERKRLEKRCHPRRLDGMIVLVDRQRYERLVRLCRAITTRLCEYQQRKLFRELLPCTQQQAQERLAELFPEQYFGSEAWIALGSLAATPPEERVPDSQLWTSRDSGVYNDDAWTEAREILAGIAARRRDEEAPPPDDRPLRGCDRAAGARDEEASEGWEDARAEPALETGGT